MGSSGVQMVCVALGVMGLIGAIVCCALPLWKVSAFIGNNILTAQAARAMTIISCMLCGLSLLVLFCGADFTTCVQNEDAKPKLSLVAGVGLLLAGLLVIIPVSWSANITVRDFNNPLFPNSQKREMGACIYIGWAAGVLLILAGGLLCCFSRPKSGSSGGTAKYYSNSASAPNKNYV
ncbi:hypothetical protein GOODEAATRI_028261 [Goodea atripinnis]|uniref:Uncharacterized protein n=1 Tax=Goodea atripinnis TaxID=208336 RepID=A0ABV0MW16_9TELE